MNQILDFILRDWFTPTPPTLQPGQLIFHNHEMAPRNKKVSLPETYKTVSDRMFHMNHAMVEYTMAILHTMNPTMADADFIKAYSSLYASDRAFSNKHGYNSGDFAIEDLECGGGTKKVKTGIPQKRAGYWCYDVYAIDPNHLPDPTKIDVTLHIIPVISSIKKILDQYGVWTGLYYKTPFYQFNYNIVPFFGLNGTNAIRCDQVTPLQGSVIPRPFVP
jgi:hypothetical protein